MAGYIQHFQKLYLHTLSGKPGPISICYVMMFTHSNGNMKSFHLTAGYAFYLNYPQSTAPQSDDIQHIIAQWSYYKDIRARILFQMKILCRQSKSDINFKFILRNNHLITQFILDYTILNLPEKESIKMIKQAGTERAKLSSSWLQAYSASD